MVQETEIQEINPPIGLEVFFKGKSPKLWCSGERSLLNGKPLAVISARRMDSDLAAKSAEFLRELASLKNVSFIGGWHSSLEKEALRGLLSTPAQIIFCVAKSLLRFTPPVEIDNRLRRGQALLLTHCSPKAKRISREASLRRNRLVVGLARAVLVLSAPEGSGSLQLAKSALQCGKPVLMLDDRRIEELLPSGALPASLENIKKILG